MSREPTVERITTVGDAWRAVELQRLADGTALPLHHRASWAERMGEHWLLVARDEAGHPRGSIALEVRRPRALPGHKFLRVHRLRANAPPDAIAALLGSLRELVAADPGILGVAVASQSVEPAENVFLAPLLAALGFTESAEPEGYLRTILLDLRRDDDALLRSMTSMGRRNVRKVLACDVDVETLTQREWLPAMEALLRETRSRTHGALPRRSLAGLLALANERPDLVQISGLVSRGERKLLAFATGLHHGDHASYGDGASTRSHASRLPLGYGPIWSLLGWARANGARWFDLGGIATAQPGGGPDPLAGITAFKRQFGGVERTVGAEWNYTPRPRRAAMAQGLGAALRQLWPFD